VGGERREVGPGALLGMRVERAEGWWVGVIGSRGRSCSIKEGASRSRRDSSSSGGRRGGRWKR